MGKYTKYRSTSRGTFHEAPASKTSAENTVPEVIGGPPESGSQTLGTENIRTNSMMIVEITPCTLKLQNGLSLFTVDDTEGKSEYEKLLTSLGYKLTTDNIVKLACLAESFPSDTFTNEYGEHFLNQILDVAGSASGQLTQMSGKENAMQAVEEFSKMGAAGAASMGGASGELFENFLTAMSGAAGKLDTALTTASKKQGLGGSLANTLVNVLSGSRVDFPQVWKNSSYSPTLSCSIRLYNPNPASDAYTKKYIIGPLAAILALTLPISEEQSFYKWPLFCKVDCKGMFNIPLGAISNITIAKGGDGGSFGFNQRSSIVDVKMDFINLHSVLFQSSVGESSRPTLKSYLDNFLTKKETLPIYLDQYSQTYVSDTTTSVEKTKKWSPSTSSSTSYDRTSSVSSRSQTANKTIESSLTSLSNFYTA